MAFGWEHKVCESGHVTHFSELAYAEHKYMPSLQRLFAHENETLQLRSSTHMDLLSTTSAFIDPLQAIISQADQADDGLTRSLRCLLMCIRSGAIVPTQIFLQFLSLISTSSPHCLQDASILSECVMLSLWIRSLGRQELQNVISQMHAKMSSRITACLVTGTDVATGCVVRKVPPATTNSYFLFDSLRIIRHSLASCLRIYGCERSSVVSAGIVQEDEIHELPSRSVATLYPKNCRFMCVPGGKLGIDPHAQMIQYSYSRKS